MAEKESTYRISGILRETAGIYGKIFFELITISFITNALTGICAAFFTSEGKPVVWISFTALALYFVFLNMGYATAMVKINAAYSGENKGAINCFIAACGKIFRILSASFIYPSLIFFGLIALIIPGVYSATVFFFALCAAAIEDKNVGPFNFSKILVKGDFWKVLIIAVLYYVPIGIYMLLDYYIQKTYNSIPASTTMFIIHVLLWPIFVSFITVAYLTIKKAKKDKISPSEIKSIGTPLGCLLSVVISAAMFILIVLFFNYMNLMQTKP